jgi:hypothetical protein
MNILFGVLASINLVLLVKTLVDESSNVDRSRTSAWSGLAGE